MNDLSFGEDGPKRELHGDVLLRVEEILTDEGAVVGTDVRTGEAFKIQLATAEDMAKHFVSPRDSNRPFEDRLASARKRIEDRPTIMPDPDDDTALHVEVGSVLGFENVRSFTGLGNRMLLSRTSINTLVKSLISMADSKKTKPEKKKLILVTGSAPTISAKINITPVTKPINSHA